MARHPHQCATLPINKRRLNAQSQTCAPSLRPYSGPVIHLLLSGDHDVTYSSLSPDLKRLPDYPSLSRRKVVRVPPLKPRRQDSSRISSLKPKQKPILRFSRQVMTRSDRPTTRPHERQLTKKNHMPLQKKKKKKSQSPVRSRKRAYPFSAMQEEYSTL
ncbi:hypothetical protein EJ05DRAFT_363446 [Pseudovirgaria hyperparasitica]|uniref:Uncharacterized protein n=1 Tax=Pseudovirgaria hyperparasitica TaxID=470096 RepID=A0A6A6WCC7_9PEZI|nr:uncharacterized protein EJ05DRAFT_363446 [Pseudovirgaria hyperparasitica]KAF2758761.1 hypothetical protein EJ05DRAFT_363446 [Pseudovirgaria hyperparasitica]